MSTPWLRVSISWDRFRPRIWLTVLVKVGFVRVPPLTVGHGVVWERVPRCESGGTRFEGFLGPPSTSTPEDRVLTDGSKHQSGGTTPSDPSCHLRLFVESSYKTLCSPVPLSSLVWNGRETITHYSWFNVCRVVKPVRRTTRSIVSMKSTELGFINNVKIQRLIFTNSKKRKVHYSPTLLVSM